MSDPSVTSESSGSSLAETCKWSFRLELFSQEQALSSLWLPARADGFLKFPDGICPFLSVESQEDRWVLCCAGPAFFADVALDQFTRIPLQGDRMVTVEYEGIRYFLFAEAVSRARLTYSTYALHSETEIRIGNTLDCDLYFRSQNIYREICTLRRKDRQWSFSCSDADCPVFVNGIRKNGGVLYIGDFLYILGLHVIIGPKHLPRH